MARRSLERASGLEPSDPDTLTQCASAAFDLRDLPLAAEYAQRAYEAAPEGDFALAGGLLRLFGRLQLEKGEYARAETSLRLAFERDPDPPGFGRALALKLCEQGRDAEALEVVREALRHLPDDPSLMALQAGLSAGDAPDDPIRRERRRAVRRERRGRHRG